MASTVYFHIGLPKTGTTYLQAALWNNLDVLREQGYELAAEEFMDHRRATGDLTGRRTGNKASGAWDVLAHAIRSVPANVIISDEQSARANPEQVGRIVETLAPDDVTMVITVRDLARQIASAWQQSIKQRGVLTLAEMSAAIRNRSPDAEYFWQVQDVVPVLDGWLSHVPPERIVMVTVPPAGSPEELLWQRFAEAVGLRSGDIDLNVERPNESLGAAQVEVLRRMNTLFGDRDVPHYPRVARRMVANVLLATQVDHVPFAVDEITHAWATEHAHAVVESIKERGIRVVGSLDDLVPAPRQPSIAADSDEPHITAAAIQALSDLVVRWQQIAHPVARRAEGERHTSGAHRRPRHPNGSADESEEQ